MTNNTSGATTYTPLATTSGPPTSGPHNAGDVLTDPSNQCLWVCREAGDPGVWFNVGIGSFASGTAGLTPHDRVRLATVEALPSCTYASGVLTAVANGALTVDAVAAAVGDRVVVKDEADSPENNGIYTVISKGSGSAPWILQRAADMDSGAEAASAYVFVIEGDVNQATAWYTGPGPFTLGTDGIVFSQFSGSTSYIGDAPVIVAGNRIGVITGITEGTLAAGDDERFAAPRAPTNHAASHYPGTGSTGIGEGADAIATSAFTQAPVYAPAANSLQVIRPAGYISNAARTLTIADKDVGYYVPFDLPADCPQIPGVTHYIKTAAGGGGGAPSSFLTGDSSTFEAGVGIWTANTNAQTPASVTNWAHGGTHSMRIRATAAGKVKVRAGGGAGALNNRATCAPGDTFTCAGFARAAATPRSIRWYVDYFNASHNYLGTISGTSVSDATSGTGVNVPQVFTVPATLGSGTTGGQVPASAGMGIEVNGTAAASEDHYFDDATISKSAGSGGTSGAVIRYALYASDESGQRPTGTPLATTGPIDATIAGASSNLFPAGPWDPGGVPQRVFLERVYQHSSVPSPYPTLVDCVILPYAAVTGVDDGSVQMGVKQTSGVGGALSGVAASADATTDLIPYAALGAGEVTGGGDPDPPPSGSIQFGMAKGLGPTNTGGGNIATATTVLENIAKAANGGVNVHFSCTRIYHAGLGSSGGFPTAEETAYHNLNNNGKSNRTLYLSIANQGKNADGTYQAPYSEIAAGLHNSKIDAWGTKLKAESDRLGGREIWVCLQHEIDAHMQTGQSAADFVAASQVFYDRLKAKSSKIMVYWIPTAFGFSTGKAQGFFPGSSALDAIGCDGYNPSRVWNGSDQWIEFKDVFKTFLAWASIPNSDQAAVPHIVIGEFGCANDTVTPNLARRATWLTNMLAEVKTNPKWSRLKALIYWDNHDNKHPKKPGTTQDDPTKWLYPYADWTWENLTTTVPASPNNTADNPTVAAVVAVATDSVME